MTAQAMTAPAFNAVVVATAEGVDHLPNPVMPYYALFGDGLFLHRTTELGRALIPTKNIPDTLPKSEFEHGLFTFTADPVPAAIAAQAVDFFRRIYTKHKSEAEVLITRNYKTGAYRLFVPHQRVNGTAVHSIYEPTNISRSWMVVGTMHSHCMFGAFHSGTDERDAADMDGIHFTVGMVLNEKPEVAGMVSMNKVNFHYKGDEALSAIGDFSDLTAGTAPEWWDTFVYPTGTPAKLNETKFPSLGAGDFAKFYGLNSHTPKPIVGAHGLTVGVQPTRSMASSLMDDWDAQAWGMGSRHDLPFDDAVEAYWTQMGYLPGNVTPRFVGRGPAQNQADAIKGTPRKVKWLKDGSADFLDADDFDLELYEGGFGAKDDIPDAILETMIESDLLTDADWMNPSGDLAYWTAEFLQKLGKAADVLRALGLTVKVSAIDKRIKVLPGQTEAFPTDTKGKD